MVLGILATLAFMAFRGAGLETWADRLEAATWCFVIPAISAFLAMNFTGASTYTSLSGVKKEMHRAVPLQIGAGILGLGLWLGSHFIS
jgi:acetyl-CoA decarbonylase/synthase complex subunit gamma